MNWEAISAIAEVVGAVGIIITLVYLATQIRQNTRQMRSQGLQVAITHFLTSLDATTGTDPDAELFRKGLNDFDSLSTNEQACFHSKMHPLLYGFNAVLNQYRAGFLPESELAAARAIFVSMLITPGGKQWWESFRHAPPVDLVAHIEDVIRNAEGEISSATEMFPWLRPD